MAELLPDHLGSATTQTLTSKRYEILNILEWIRCFGAYIVVSNTKQPHRVPDLLGYLMLITEAHMQHTKDGWMGYNCSIRQIVATKSYVTCAQIDTTLWNLAFSAKTRLVHCKLCFSITHTSAECKWAPDQQCNSSETQSQQQPSTQSGSTYLVSLQQHRICMLYNRESTPSCSFPNCKF